MTLPYRSFSAYLRGRLGGPAQRVPLALATTCPQRAADGSGGCTFCDAAGSGAPWLRPGTPVAAQLHDGLRRLRPGVRALAYFQAFTTGSVAEAQWREALAAVEAEPRVAGVIAATRPDALPDWLLTSLASLLSRYDVWLELGLQTANDATLQRIRRGHDAQAFADACARARRAGVPVAAHVILGLPGEAMADWQATARCCAAQPVAGIKLHSLYVLRDTELARQWQAGAYVPLSLADYVAGVRAFLEVLPAATVVMRLTGEGPADRVLAPEWCRDKQRVLAALRAAGVTAATAGGSSSRG